jgi:hypothetical protein
MEVWLTVVGLELTVKGPFKLETVLWNAKYNWIVKCKLSGSIVNEDFVVNFTERAQRSLR